MPWGIHHGYSVQRLTRYRRPSKPVYHPKQISSPNLHKLSSKTTTANEVSFLGSFRSPTRPDFVTQAHLSLLRRPKMQYISRKYNVCNRQSHLAYQKASAANPNHLHLVFTYTRRKCYVTLFLCYVKFIIETCIASWAFPEVTHTLRNKNKNMLSDIYIPCLYTRNVNVT